MTTQNNQSPLSKHFARLALLILAVTACGGESDATYNVGKEGEQPVRVYIEGRDPESTLDLIRGNGVEFQAAESAKEADATVTFCDGCVKDGADAVSFAYRGHMDVNNDIESRDLPTLLGHEFLHLVGRGHSDDPNSPMAPSARRGSMTGEDWREVQKLAGMTQWQRWRAQAEAVR